MEHQLLHIADCEREVRIQLAYAEAAPAIEAAYEHAQQDLTIEGFRKGKAPIELIKQRYGAKIEADALESLGQRLVRELARQQQWALLSDPQLINIQRSPESIGFTFRYYTLPELQIDLAGIKLQKPVVEVTDEDVESQLERLRLRYGTVQETAEQVTDYYHEVTLHFQPTDPMTGTPLLGEQSEEITFALYDPEIPLELRERLLNTRVGDSFLHTFSGTDFGQPEQPAQAYQITVHAIRRILPAELTPEFVHQISGGQLHDVESLRQFLRKELQQQHERDARSILRSQLELELARRYPFTPPKPVVQSIARDLIQSLQRGELHVPAEYLREGEAGIYRFLAELAELQARLSVLELLLLRQYQVQLAPEELNALAQSLNMAETDLRKQLQEDPDLEYDLRRRKLWQLLLQNTDVEPVPYADYVRQHPHA
ncbi:MAG: hypothetical protein NZ949_00395 [Candidatus Kapabacteria bacterium]|nr:hypothetical protein [Candidatus Kapabacteria bacterium]MDW7997108.1 trigger factor [Bacteroidota bacterium]MDW8226030.1 trigger factor [Bacteroidota bacterium]